MMYPKPVYKKKRKQHKPSILQRKDGTCYLCTRLDGFYGRQPLQEHHIFGGPNRIHSEAYGLKVYLKQYISCRNDRNEYLFPKANLKVGGSGISAMSAATKNAGVKPRNWWTAPELIGTGHIDKGTVEDRLRKLGKKCGIEKVHPHRFRRTGATFALRRGMPIEQVSKLLGHESIETTQIYLDISERELEQSHKKYV